MECQICRRDKLVFFCTTIAGSHIIACVSCAVACGLKVIEEVLLEKEVRDEQDGVEAGGEGKGLSSV